MINLTIAKGVLYFDNEKWTCSRIKHFMDIFNAYLGNDFLQLINILAADEPETSSGDSHQRALKFTGRGVKTFEHTLSAAYRLLHQKNNHQLTDNLLLTVNDFKRAYQEKKLLGDIVQLANMMLNNNLYVEIYYIDVSHEGQFIMKGDGIISPLYDNEMGAYTIDVMDVSETCYEYNRDNLINLCSYTSEAFPLHVQDIRLSLRNLNCSEDTVNDAVIEEYLNEHPWEDNIEHVVEVLIETSQTSSLL